MLTHDCILFAMGSLSAASEKIEIHSESGARHKRHPPLRAVRFTSSSVILDFYEHTHRRVHFTRKKIKLKHKNQKWSLCCGNLSILAVITFQKSQCLHIECESFMKNKIRFGLIIFCFALFFRSHSIHSMNQTPLITDTKYARCELYRSDFSIPCVYDIERVQFRLGPCVNDISSLRSRGVCHSIPVFRCGAILTSSIFITN